MFRLVTFVVVAACTASHTLARPDGGDRGAVNGIRGVITDREPTNNALATPTPIEFNGRSTVAGTLRIAPTGDLDHHSFVAGAGEVFLIMTCPLSGLPNNFDTPDTLVEVFNAGGTELISDDDAAASFPGGASDGSVVRFRAPAAGTYTIRVSELGDNATGSYALMVSRLVTPEYGEDPSDVISDPTILGHTLAGPLLGTANAIDGEFDFFAFDLNPGDVIMAAVTGIENPAANLNTPNCTIRLIGPDQVTVLDTSIDDGGGNFPGGLNTSDNPSIVFRAPSQGRYYIEVTAPAVVGVQDYLIASALIPAAYCPGDADGSGNVAFLDITTVLANFGNVCP